MPVSYLTLNIVIKIHEQIIANFGGAEGLRNRDGLASAVEQPSASFGGDDLYPTIFDKASVYAFHIAESQAFVDGNKRTAIQAALTFLAINNYPIDPSAETDLFQAMVGIANKTMRREELSELFRNLVIDSLTSG
jgi:death-on-curing protein